MKALECRTITVAGSLFALAAIGSSSLEAQRRAVTPDPNAPRFMVLTLKSTDKNLGVQAAEAIRARLTQDFGKQTWVIIKNDIHATLEGSGFNPIEAPDPITSRLLAQQLRADEYLEGTVSKTAGGFRIEPRMVLTRDNSMVQPLPVAEAARLEQAAAAVSSSVQAARRQLGDLRKCENAMRDNKPQDAVTAARAAIVAYPNSTLARICLANAYVALKMPGDSVISETEKVLAIDGRNKPALNLAAQAYREKGEIDKAVGAWSRLIATDPTNAKLVADVVPVIAGSGKAQLALPIIKEAVAQNPGDPALTRLLWLIQLTVKDWKGAIATGEEMARSDTAAADSTFFLRLAVAYQSDSQPQKAADATARGVAKFPNNAELWSTHAQMLRQAGQMQPAMEAARRAITINPKVEHGHYRLALIQLELGQRDAAFASLRNAVQNGEDKALVGQVVAIEGNKAWKAANASKKREDYEHAVQVLTVADSIAPTPTVKFLLGASAFYVGDAAVRENQKQKSCELATLAENSFTTAQINLPPGAMSQKEAAEQLLQAVGQYTPAVESQKKKFCKKPRNGRRS